MIAINDKPIEQYSTKELEEIIRQRNIVKLKEDCIKRNKIRDFIFNNLNVFKEYATLLNKTTLLKEFKKIEDDGGVDFNYLMEITLHYENSLENECIKNKIDRYFVLKESKENE